MYILKIRFDGSTEEFRSEWESVQEAMDHVRALRGQVQGMDFDLYFVGQETEE